MTLLNRFNFGIAALSVVFCAALMLLPEPVQARTNSYPNFKFSPTEQSILCPKVLDVCPEGSTSKTVNANAVENDAKFNGEIMANNGCGSEGTNLGCIKYFETPQTINVCCQASKSTSNACLNEAVSECGNSSTDGSESDTSSYKCLTASACGLYAGASPLQIGGTGASRPCPNAGDVCCKIARCAKPGAAKTSSAAKPPTEYKLTNPLGVTSIPVILGRIIKTFLGIIGAIALAAFVYGGLMWMTARGDASQVKKGQDALKNAAIGLFLVMFSYTLAGNIATFLTAEQKDIAAQENRTGAEPETVKGGDTVTLTQQLNQAQDKQTQGQAAAAQAGAQAGVTTPTATCDSPNLTENEKSLCNQQQVYLYCKSSFQDESSKNFQDCMKSAQKAGGASGEVGGAVAEWLGTGQSTYNSPTPNASMPGGQKDCKYATDPDKCSTIGWKTVCNQKVFDTGYGTYNNVGCYSPSDCQPGTVLSNDCAQAGNILLNFPGVPPLGCMTSAVGIGAECQKMNQLCCKMK